MMRDLFRRFAALAVIAAVACAAASEPAAADLIGLVKRVKSSAYGTPPGSEREKKFRRFPIVQEELLETGAAAGMVVEFLDETTLTLGADASLGIDTFVYDPASANVTTVLKLSVGTLRFNTGKIGYAKMQIITPTAAIAIRGSDAIISVAPDGATTVAVLDGEFEVSNSGGDEQATVGPAESVSVSATGSVGAVAPGPTEPPAELYIPSPRDLVARPKASLRDPVARPKASPSRPRGGAAGVGSVGSEDKARFQDYDRDYGLDDDDHRDHDEADQIGRGRFGGSRAGDRGDDKEGGDHGKRGDDEEGGNGRGSSRSR